jgi:membrane protease YdiL (CAAX protease family)
MHTPTRQTIFTAATKPKNRVRSILWACGALALVVVGALIGQIALAPFSGALFEASDKTMLTAASRQWVYLVLGFAPVYFLLWMLIRLREKRGIGSVFGAARPIALFAGLIVGVALSVTPLLVISLASGYEVRVGEPNVDNFIFIVSLALGLSGLAFQCFAEELVFRGWLLPTLTDSLGSIAAILVSSLAFAAAHSLNPQISLMQVASLIVAGAVMGVLTIRTESIWAAGLAHTFWNWIQFQGFVAHDAILPVGHLFEGAPLKGKELETTTEFAVFATLILILISVWLPKRSNAV